MIWSLIAICLIFFGSREFLLGLIIVLKRAHAWDAPTDFCDFLTANSRKTFKILVCKNLNLKVISWKTSLGPHLIADESWWQSLSEDQKKMTLLWFSIAQEKFLFVQRLSGLVKPEQIDRDCLIEGAELSTLLEIINSLKMAYENSAAHPLESSLSGLSLYGGIQNESLKNLEFRLQAIIKASERLNALP